MVKSQHYIGLMSGTSADSLDAALVDFSAAQPKLLNTHSCSLNPTTRQRIHQLALNQANEIEQICELDQEIADLSCQAVRALLQKAKLAAADIDAIGSHGQTIRHYPPTPNAQGFSLQVGDPNIIAQNTGITTVADFRRRDIAAGGHGAPLAPAFHHAAFQSEDVHRIIVNLGGIANITSLPKIGTPVGYDTGPANGLMDSWSQKHLHQPYDKNGDWARSGKVDTGLLALLLSHSFFKQTPPKSTGREDFNLSWLEQQLDTYEHTLASEDVQASLLELTVESLSRTIETEDASAEAEIYICGGGAQNQFLMDMLTQRLTPRILSSTEALGVAPDWVEAMAFAWLAKQTINRATGNLPSVTGACEAVVLGGIYLA